MKYFFVVLVVLLIFGCSIPSDFGIPTWKTKLHLKFFNDEYTVEDLAAEDSTLFVQDSILAFDKTIRDTQNIGNFRLDNPDPKNTQFYLYELAPDSLDLQDFQGVTVPFIPAFSMIPVNKSLAPFSEFEEITFSSGEISLDVVNNACIWLGNKEAGEPLTLSIVDFVSDEEIVSFTSENDIPPNGGTGLVTGSIADVIFPNTLKLLIYGGSKGSDGQPATIDTMATIGVTVQISDIQASYVRNARIPKQSIDPVIGNYQTGFEYPEIHGDFELLGYRKIELNFFSPVPASFKIDITAINSSDLSMVKLLPFNSDSLYFEIPQGNTSVVLSSEDYNLNEFITILPDSFAYEIYPTVGDTSQVFDLDFNDDVNIDIEIYTEFQIQTGVTGIWLVPMKNNEVLVDTVKTGDFQQKYYDAFISGGCDFKYLNTAGVEMKSEILIARNKEDILSEIYHFDNPDTSKITLIEIPYLETTENSVYKDISIVMQQNDLDYFLEDSVFVCPRFNVYSEGEHPLSGGVKLLGELNLEFIASDELIHD